MAETTTATNGRTFHSNDRTYANFQEPELRKLCGVAPGEFPLYVAKELLDNAAAALEDEISQAMLTGWALDDGLMAMLLDHNRPRQMRITVQDDGIEVVDSGIGISDRVLDQILDFTRFGGSNRHHKLPTRGAQGNAFMTIVGIAALWGTRIVVGRRMAPTVSITVTLDDVRERVDVHRVQVSERPASEPFIWVQWPKLPTKRGGCTTTQIIDVCSKFARLNPHITISLRDKTSSSGHRMRSFPGSWMTGPALSNAHTGAASWFTVEEMADRLAADVRARPEMPVGSWMGEFLGYSGDRSSDVPIEDMVTDDRMELLKLAARLKTRMEAAGSSVPQPKFNPVGEGSLAAMLVDAGADLNCKPCYHQESGTFQRGEATVPFLIEACLVQMPAGVRNGVPPILAMNRTVLYGSPTFEGKWREKVRGPHHAFRGTLDGFADVYKFDHGLTSSACVVHITCPSPGYQSYGKQAFDTKGFSEALSECMERVTLQIRRQQAGDARRRQAGAEKADSIKDTLLRILPEVYDDWTVGGKLPILIRNLYYGVRGVWEQHHPDELQYPTYCAYIDLWERQMGREMVLKDPRGTLLEPHSGKSVRLGTTEIAGYNPKRWEGHTIIFIEKENFVHVLNEWGIPKRFDAIVIGSKGFAVESCRVVLQKYRKLLGKIVKIIALHDADPAGYMIGHDLATNLPRFGESVEVDVIDVGLRMAEGLDMGLLTEPFELKKANWAMIKNMRNMTTRSAGRRRPLLEQEAWDQFLPSMFRGDEFPTWAEKPKGRRIELNAMKPERFIKWLEGHLEDNGCRKVRPPDDVVGDRVRDSRTRKVEREVGAMLMEMLGQDLAHEIIGEVGVPTVDLDAMLIAKPEQHWSSICDAAGERGVDLAPIIRERLRRKLASGAL